jgi:hypothetical protein
LAVSTTNARIVAGLLAAMVAVSTALIQARHAARPRAAAAYATAENADDAVWMEPKLDRARPFPETIRTGGPIGDCTLQLTGSFVRRRPILFLNLDVYEIASYVETPKLGSTEELLDGLLIPNQRRAYHLRFLLSLSGKQVMEAFDDEVSRSFGDVDMEKHGADVKAFVNLLADGVSAGDVVYLLWTPDGCLFAGFKRNRALERITSEPSVARAIWRIWAGPTAEPGRAGLVARYRTDE